MQKTLCQIAPPKYKPPGGLVLGICPWMQSKTKQNGKFPFHYNLAQPIL